MTLKVLINCYIFFLFYPPKVYLLKIIRVLCVYTYHLLILKLDSVKPRRRNNLILLLQIYLGILNLIHINISTLMFDS